LNTVQIKTELNDCTTQNEIIEYKLQLAINYLIRRAKEDLNDKELAQYLLEEISVYQTAAAKPETERTPFENSLAFFLLDDYEELEVNNLLKKLEEIATKEEEERPRTPQPMIRRFLSGNHIKHIYDNISRKISELEEEKQKFILVDPVSAHYFASPA